VFLNLTQRLLQALKARGATEIFGIPGDFALPLFREIEHSGLLPLHTLSHEPGMGFAADAAARLHGGLGVAAVTYGAGAFNLVNAVASAYAERVPLVVLSGAPAAHEAARGYLLHHQVKTLDAQWRVFAELTVDRARLDDAERAPALIARVLDAALARARPVYLEIPRDMPARNCADVPATAPAAPDAGRAAGRRRRPDGHAAGHRGGGQRLDARTRADAAGQRRRRCAPAAHPCRRSRATAWPSTGRRLRPPGSSMWRGSRFGLRPPRLAALR
jgi:thiamine pyrophosphate-dependent acetolactate synthase large subunit-like protein